jgi:tyrosyl-tRNA synthetase
MYQERMKTGDTINLREFLYPLLQGYDSVAMNVDLEVGGTDQTFNMLAGRTLVKAMKRKEKLVMTVPLLTDSKGVKIGKTEGNVIGLTDPPHELYGKIMSLGDDSIVPCFMLLTDMPDDEIDVMKTEIEAGANPMPLKKRLAYELTRQLNTDHDAQEAQAAFEVLFQKHDASKAEIPLYETSTSQWNIIDLLIATKTVASRSQAKRLIDQHAVEINGACVGQTTQYVSLAHDDILKVGKKKFIKIHML